MPVGLRAVEGEGLGWMDGEAEVVLGVVVVVVVVLLGWDGIWVGGCLCVMSDVFAVVDSDG